METKRLFMITLCLTSILFACKTRKNVFKSEGLSKLNGTWQLNYITGPRITFEGLYPGKKPTLLINTSEKIISGNGSCNSYSSVLVADDHKISFKAPIAATMMSCVNGGDGEAVYFKTLEKVNAYTITDTTLNLMINDIVLMRFSKNDKSASKK